MTATPAASAACPARAMRWEYVILRAAAIAPIWGRRNSVANRPPRIHVRRHGARRGDSVRIGRAVPTRSTPLVAVALAGGGRPPPHPGVWRARGHVGGGPPPRAPPAPNPPPPQQRAPGAGPRLPP